MNPNSKKIVAKTPQFKLNKTTLLLSALLLAPLMPMSVYATELDKTIQFNIPAQTLDEAVLSFARQSGMQLVVNMEVLKGLHTKGVTGNKKSIQAISQLLKKSGLTYKIVGNDTIVILPEGKVPTSGKDRLTSIKDDQGTRTSGEEEQANNNEDTIEHLLVTGSRIARIGATSPTPVTSIDVEAMELSGDVRLADLLNELPAIRATQTAGNVNSSDNAQEAGTSFLNLRGLGIDRTLVLVNGRRHIGSRAGSAAVDLNTIPTSLIKRIEVITGGASAVYGADAVSGVINLITKKDFEGLEVSSQVGMSSERDGKRLQLSITGGANFADDRGNIYFTASRDKSLSARADNRDWATKNARFAPNPADTGPSDGIAGQIIYNNTGFIGTPAAGQVVGPNGQLFESQGGPFTFDQNGNITSQAQGELVLPWLSQGGDFVDLSSFDLLAVPVEGTIVASGLTFDMNDEHQFFVDAKFAKSVSHTNGQPTFNLGFDASASGIPGAFIKADNPYVPQALRNILAGNPNDANDDLAGFYVGRTNVDQGGRRSRSDRDTIQFYIGTEGVLTNNIDYTMHYQYGETNNTTEFINERINNRFLQQIDVVAGSDGVPACSDPSNNCVPLNILGPNASTAEALAFSQVDFLTESRLTQQAMHFSVNGFSGIELQGGEIAFAAGVEYREETSSTEEGFLRNTGAIFATAPVNNTKGEFDVSEIFAEATFPLLVDVAFAEEFYLEAAARYADYSSIGAATTWKFGADWVINENIRIRATVSEAVRAPNIGELNASVEQSNQFVNDPCDVNLLTSGSNTRSANCAALGLPNDFQSNSSAFTRAVLSGGNTNLKEESAETTTVGIVFSPSYIDNLSITLDYWDIAIDGAINSFSAQATANGCVDASSLDNPLCSSITRDSSGNIATVSNQLINIASFEATGVDVEIHYLYGFDGGDELRFSLLGTYLDKLDFYAKDGEEPDHEAGELGDPELQFNFRTTYRKGDLSVSLEQRYFSDQKFDISEEREVRSPNNTGAIWYTDMQTRYVINNSLEVYAGINNLFNEQPPALALVPETRAFGNDAVVFDQIGRYFYTGFKYSF